MITLPPLLSFTLETPMDYEKWVRILGNPIYVFTKLEGRYICDKVYKETGLQRIRYMLTTRRCTCMSYAKKEYCKHINMLNKNGQFLKGIPTDVAMEEIKRVREIVSPDLDWKINTDKMPIRVETVTIKVMEWPEEALFITKIVEINGGQFMLTLEKLQVSPISS